MTCGYPGKVSELHWQFVGHRKTATFTVLRARFPADTPNAKTTTNTVQFAGSRITIFEDKYQVIVMEMPKKNIKK